MNPLVSIILPTYNGKEDRISQSIESVLNQTFTDFEFIIINDCSTNDVEKTILNYKKRDQRIIYLKNEKNLKITKTLNKGISCSKGKYIARIDDDDIRDDERKLEKQVKFMEEHTDYGLCGAGLIIEINEEGNFIKQIKMRCSDRELRNSILGCNQFAHPSIIIRKSVFNEVGVYNPKWNMVEDYELWLRIGVKLKFANLDKTSIKYRINSKGISKTNKKYQMKLGRKLFLKYYKYYPRRFKAIILRIGDFILGDKIKSTILSIIK